MESALLEMYNLLDKYERMWRTTPPYYYKNYKNIIQACLRNIRHGLPVEKTAIKALSAKSIPLRAPNFEYREDDDKLRELIHDINAVY